MIRRKCTLTILFFGLSLTCSQLPAFQALEIPRPMLRGVAKTVVRGGTPIIYYNPIALKRMAQKLASSSAHTNMLTCDWGISAGTCLTALARPKPTFTQR